MNPISLKRILFKKLIPMTGEEWDDGEIILRDGFIEAIHPQVSASFSGKTYDLSNHLILPGFVNAHCHLSLSALAGKIPQGLKFTDWIKQVVKENESLLWQERISAVHEQTQVMLRSGVTALGDYFSHPELLVEFAQLPFNQILFIETFGFQSAMAENRVQLVEEVLQQISPQSDHLRLGIAPHAPYSVSPVLLKRLRDLADKYSCPVSCHVAEVPEETEFLQSGQGDFLELLRNRGVEDPSWKPPQKTPAKYLKELGIFPLLGVHLNHIDQDLNWLGPDYLSAAFCPGSTLWFERKQWMPVKKLLDLGVPVGIGTDSLASNDSLNFLEEIRKIEKLSPGISRIQILEMATCLGAKALNLNNGIVCEGNAANLVGFKYPESFMDWWDIPFENKLKEADFVMIRGEKFHPN